LADLPIDIYKEIIIPVSTRIFHPLDNTHYHI
jgi:hypothetical protein